MAVFTRSAGVAARKAGNTASSSSSPGKRTRSTTSDSSSSNTRLNGKADSTAETPHRHGSSARLRAAGEAGPGAEGSVSNQQTSQRSQASKSKSKSFPPTTEDGRYIIVNNRRWRATDPLVPAEALAELKHYLALGRSGVGKANRAAVGGKASEGSEEVILARKRTGLAKLGLGERGQPEWWNAEERSRTERWEGALKELRKLDG